MFGNLTMAITKLQSELTSCLNNETLDIERIEILRQRILSLRKVARMFDDPDVIESNKKQVRSAASFSDVVSAFNHVLGDRLDDHRAKLYRLALGEIKSEHDTLAKKHLCLISSRQYPKKSEARVPVLELVPPK